MLNSSIRAVKRDSKYNEAWYKDNFSTPVIGPIKYFINRLEMNNRIEKQKTKVFKEENEVKK